MKKLYLFMGCMLAAGSMLAQISTGIKINPGFGFIRSSDLSGILQSHKAEDNKVVSYDSNTGAGFNIGLGGFGQYNVTSKLGIVFEPTFNLLFSRIYLNYKREELDNEGSGTQMRISSTAKLRVFYVNLPVVVKYTVWERKKVYALGGLSININTKPKLTSEEKRVDAEFKYNNLTESTVSEYRTSASLNQFSTTQMNFIIGVGKNFRRALKNFSVDVRYNIPLTKSMMYNTSSEALASTYNNSIFSAASSGDEVTRRRPDNFRMSVINVSIKYTMYKK